MFSNENFHDVYQASWCRYSRNIGESRNQAWLGEKKKKKASSCKNAECASARALVRVYVFIPSSEDGTLLTLLVITQLLKKGEKKRKRSDVWSIQWSVLKPT